MLSTLDRPAFAASHPCQCLAGCQHVQNPPQDTSTGKPTAGATTFVLDLSPIDATNVVHAVGHSTLYMALLPPDNKDGYEEPGVIGAPYARVVGVGKA